MSSEMSYGKSAVDGEEKVGAAKPQSLARGTSVSVEIFAEWLRRQGHDVQQSASSYWYSQGPRVYQAFPYHWLIHPAEEELREFLSRQKAIALRYSTSLDAAHGCLSYHAVYQRPCYGLEDLGQWARKNVRRGLRNCQVEPISFGRLAEDGWGLQLDTLERQGRRLKLSRETWTRRCLAAAGLPGFEAWGALLDGRLAASVITFEMGDWCYMLYQQCLHQYLQAHVNNAVSFVVTQRMISRPHIHSILYGLHSLDAPPSVDEFKFRMGYTAKPVRQRAVFHPWLRPVAVRASYAVVKALTRLRPGNPTLSKTEGMMRFFLHGRLPISEQPVPQPLQ